MAWSFWGTILFVSLHFQTRALPMDDGPTVCYEDCNNAYKIALGIGRRDALCVQDSDFRNAYKVCASCLEEFEGPDPTIGTKFEQFLAFCDMGLSYTTEAFNLGGGVTTTLKYIDEVPTAPVTTTTDSQSSSSTAPRDTPSTAARDPVEEESGGSKAWIAGPVVGSVAGVALFSTGIWLCLRRRRNDAIPDDSSYDKPQLHSDCVPKEPPAELDPENIHEMETPPLTAPPSEKPANEAAAQEMPG